MTHLKLTCKINPSFAYQLKRKHQKQQTDIKLSADFILTLRANEAWEVNSARKYDSLISFFWLRFSFKNVVQVKTLLEEFEPCQYEFSETFWRLAARVSMKSNWQVTFQFLEIDFVAGWTFGYIMTACRQYVDDGLPKTKPFLKFFWRVWSWLRMNAGGTPNTCKSNAYFRS